MRPLGSRSVASADTSITRLPDRAALPPRLKVLWIDDQVESRDSTVRLLETGEGIEVTVAGTAAEGLRRASAGRYDVILLDLQLPDLFGLTVLRRLRTSGISTVVVVVTGAYMEPEVEFDARRLGAAHFLCKPVTDLEQLAEALRLAAAGAAAISDASSVPSCHGLIAASPAMRDIVLWIESVAPWTVTVLLTGETGTGKEVIARAIHAASGRRGRFVAVNCGAIPDTLFESEVFGHAKGAFTGAADSRPGLLEAADGGTLFLDEVGELPPAGQVRLLRVLDGDAVRRLGETRARRLDLRVVAATNRDLQQEIARGRLREDFYYRLKGAGRRVPPLRDRPEDIEALARHWATGHAAPHGSLPIGIGEDAMRVLRAQPWRGNARELRGVLDRARCLLTGQVLGEREIVAALSEDDVQSACRTEPQTNQARAEWALRISGGKVQRAADLLGVNRSTLYRWLGRTANSRDVQS
jgi:two-component system response regulator AtoC